MAPPCQGPGGSMGTSSPSSNSIRSLGPKMPSSPIRKNSSAVNNRVGVSTDTPGSLPQDVVQFKRKAARAFAWRLYNPAPARLMPIQFFNTLTRVPEPFQPLDPAGKRVRMYTCGPTVYNFAHIGNFRAYLFEDLLQRHLEARGFAVERVMNLTDVDDKTIRGCRAQGVPLAEFTATFKQAFFEDCETLRVKKADHYPAATEQQYVAKMIEMIRLLQQKEIAYQAE